MRRKLSIAFSALAILTGAVLTLGAAPVFSQTASDRIARPLAPTSLPARFRLDTGRGLMVRAWVNGSGPYTFAIDTGAGMNLISDRVVREARLPVHTTQRTVLSGLTGATGSSNRAASIDQMALGESNNFLPPKQTALVVSLPTSVDGILDPTEAYAPNGYSIDLPNGLIRPFEGNLQQREPPAGGAIVRWIRRADARRPFVELRDGRVALIDTGSGFGLAVSERDAVILGGRGQRVNASTRDLGGGAISSRRVAPTTVSIGDLELRGVPTDILFGVTGDAPVILGRDALRPFKITFDPRRRLIEFEPPA